MPLSVFSLRPIPSKYCITAILSKAARELNINLPLETMASISSCRSQAFVRLHRPFPVINNFLPSFSLRSKICTRDPGTDNLAAAIIPAAPPPIITISLINFFLSRRHDFHLGIYRIYFIITVHLIFIPDIFQILQSAYHFILFLHTKSYDKSIDNA